MKLPKEARPILSEIRRNNFPWEENNFLLYKILKQDFNDLNLKFDDDDFYTAVWFLLSDNVLINICVEVLGIKKESIKEITWKILNRRIKNAKCRICIEYFVSSDKYNPPICRLRQSMCSIPIEKKDP